MTGAPRTRVAGAVFGGFTPRYSATNASDRGDNADFDGRVRCDKRHHEFHAWLKMKYAQYGKTETYFR